MMTMHKRLIIGITIMLMSALCSSFGQLVWKLLQHKEQAIVWYLGGLVLYALGAVLMVVALRFGELSILHPMMSCGFLFAIFWSVLVLGEVLTPQKVIGVFVIILGCIFLAVSARRKITG